MSGTVTSDNFSAVQDEENNRLPHTLGKEIANAYPGMFYNDQSSTLHANQSHVRLHLNFR